MAAGVYLHIPFCKSRCSYCDFATDVYRDAGTVDRYVRALISEVSSSQERLTPSHAVSERLTPSHGVSERLTPSHTVSGRLEGSAARSETRRLPEIDTIYFGGGTPSLLEPGQAERILDAVRQRFDIAADAEITMEMNPATVTPETLAAYREAGVNRASFGVQTFNDRDLKLLARGHDANDARSTFRMLRDAGFANISFDLIAGLPGQTIADWQRNLDEAIAMSPEHMSLYLLEIHEGTPLAEQVRSGRRKPIEEELAAEMYEVMLDRLSAAGYEQYEISNFAKPGYASRHNTKYWTLDPVFGFGVSAHSFDGTERYANERDTAAYVRSIEEKGTAEVFREEIDAASEYIFLGLRLTEGIRLGDYADKFAARFEDEYGADLHDLLERGMIQRNGDRISLTQRGMLYSNDVFARFV